MALINCPECNHEVSDKATSCPNCGYPFNNISQQTNEKENRYNIKTIKLLNSANEIKAIGFIRGLTCKGLAETKKLIENPNQVIFENLEYQSAISAQKELYKLGVQTELVAIKADAHSLATNNKVNDTLKNFDERSLICPHCGSLAVTTGQRGFSLLTGFIGSHKTVNRCGKCGHSWEPK